MLQRLNLLSLWGQLKVVVWLLKEKEGPRTNCSPYRFFQPVFVAFFSHTVAETADFWASQGFCGGESAFSHWFLLHRHLGFSFLQLCQVNFDFCICFPPPDILLNYHVHYCPFSSSLCPLSSALHCHFSAVLAASRCAACIQSFEFNRKPLPAV